MRTRTLETQSTAGKDVSHGKSQRIKAGKNGVDNNNNIVITSQNSDDMDDMIYKIVS